MKILDWIHKATKPSNKIEFDYEPENGIIIINGNAYHESFFDRADFLEGHWFRIEKREDGACGFFYHLAYITDLSNEEIAAEIMKDVDAYNKRLGEFMKVSSERYNELLDKYTTLLKEKYQSAPPSSEIKSDDILSIFNALGDDIRRKRKSE